MTEFSVSFRVKSTNLDPDGVTNALNLMPSKCHKRGDPHWGASGRRYADFSGGLWSLESSRAGTAPLDEHLLALMGQIKGRDAVIRTLALEHQLDFFIGVFGSGLGNFMFTISGPVLEEIAQLAIPLVFDIYEINEDLVTASA